jgi:rsbT antagonist protein RsbS
LTAGEPLVDYRIPVFRIGDCLLLTIQVDIEDRMIMALKDDLAERIAATQAKGVLIDISALDVVDSFVGRMLANISAIARVMDARTVIVGMRPAVAITLVELGMTLPGILTALDVDRGMALIRGRTGGEDA